ncbi:MAG TPA: glycosyltransferase family 4 protein [Candidatus Acidoferrales bacterium]|nr:glycosyltransferase family 4 protein [Candidatus Acidoferrales bacterium]
MRRNRNTVLSIFGFHPLRISSGEMYARELSDQLAARGWNSVLCFLSMPPDPVRDFLQRPNVALDVVEHTPSASLAAARGVWRVVRQYRPRILHLHFTSFLNPYSWMARALGVEQVYFTDHGSQPEGFVARRAPVAKRLAMRLIHAPMTGIVSVSGYGYRNFTARGLIPIERFHMVYNAVDLERIEACGNSSGDRFRRRFEIAPDRLVVTQVSWLIPEKGVDDFLSAARDVIAAEPRAHFVLAGDGAHRPALEKLARQLGIESQVTLTGPIVDPLAEGLFAASDVVCQLSRWEEVFGYVNAEAMACGKPLVGTRVGGIPEIVQDGVTGFLVERRDSKAAAARILELLGDPGMRRRMGEAGREVCREKFNLKKNVAQLIEIYRCIPAAHSAK